MPRGGDTASVSILTRRSPRLAASEALDMCRRQNSCRL